MMRIGWIVPGYQGKPDEPGIPALTLLAQELAQRNDLHVFAVRFPPRRLDYTVDSVPVSSFGAAPAQGNRFQSRLASVLRWAEVLRALRAEHRRAPFAVLHGFWATESGMLACAAGYLLGIPVVVSICGGEMASVRVTGYGNRRNRLERAQIALTLHLADRIGVGCEDARSRLAARYPWLVGKVAYLPLGFDPAQFRPMISARSEPRIVSVASWSPVKGHALLLDAVRLLRDWGSPVHLLLIGERTNGVEAGQAIAERGLNDWVEALGYQPQTTVAEVMNGARVSVITSWHEAQCLAVVESLACGVPVVSTPVGKARTLLKDVRFGTIVPNRTARSLAEALRTALAATETETISDRLARTQAVADLAVAPVAARFQTCYEGLIKRHERQRGNRPATLSSASSRPRSR
jgi:glycosyltransferase involved in cell wall biosynthesis